MSKRKGKPRTLWQSIRDDSRPVDMSKLVNRVLAAVCDAVGDDFIRALGRVSPKP